MKRIVNPGPKEVLLKGAAVLATVLTPHGFIFQLKGNGKGSGGDFAFGEFSRENRILELHFRYSLGLVTYHVGNCILSHETYLRYLGKWQQHKYPGFSDDPLQAFCDLGCDIQDFCEDFVCGSGEDFCRFAQEHARNPKKFKGLEVL